MSMDNMPDLSALASSDSGIGDMIGKLMSRPDLIQNIASELGLSSSSDTVAEEKVNQKEPEVSIPASASSTHGNLGKKEKTSDKERLLLALKPYLSDKRRDAIDMMLRLDSLTSLMGSIDPNLIKTLLGGGANV